MARTERLEGGQRMAADVGRHMHGPDCGLRKLERGEHRPFRAADAKARRPCGQQPQGCFHVGAARGVAGQPGACAAQVDARQTRVGKSDQPLCDHLHRVFARSGQQVLAVYLGLHVQAPQRLRQILLDVLGGAFFDHEHGGLAGAKRAHFLGHERIGDVENQQRQFAGAKRIGQTALLQRAHRRVVQAALHDQPDLAARPLEALVQAMLRDIRLRRRQALRDLEFLVAERHGRVRQAHVVKSGGLGDQLAR